VDLAAMADLVLGHVEPRPVRVHVGHGLERAREPFVITVSESRERVLARRGKVVEISGEVAPANLA